MPFEAQSGTVIYESDVRAVYDSARHWGVISGMNAITGGTLNVIVQAGSWYNSAYRVQTGTTIALTAADATNPRLDLIYASGTGAFKLDGTAAANPDPPITPGSAVRLAIVRVPANAGSVVPSNITDARALVSPLTRMFVSTFSANGNTASAAGNWTTVGSSVLTFPSANAVFLQAKTTGSSVVAGGAVQNGIRLQLQSTSVNFDVGSQYAASSAVQTLADNFYAAHGLGQTGTLLLQLNTNSTNWASGTIAGSLYGFYSLE